MKLVYINSSFVVDFIRYVRAENKKSNYFDLDEKNRDIGKLDRILIDQLQFKTRRKNLII